jgi:hypothetical protein
MTARRHRAMHRRTAAKAKRNPITYCEARFPSLCVGTYGLAPAHSKDRIDIKTQADFDECIACCEKCHFHLDREMSKADRLEFIRDVIARRDEYQAA